MNMNIPQINNADVHFSENGDVHIYIEKNNTSFIPKKRGIMGCFHLVYLNIGQRKEYTNWINVGVEF